MTTPCTRRDPHDGVLGRHLGPPPTVPRIASGPPDRLLALDPGTSRSAWIALDGRTLRPLGFGIEGNEALVERLRAGREAFDLVVIEKVESFGMAVGEEVFETVFWSGCFAEAVDPVPVRRLGRRAVKLAICGDTRAKDPNIRQALIDRYGGKERAIGTKAAPGTAPRHRPGRLGRARARTGVARAGRRHGMSAAEWTPIGRGEVLTVKEAAAVARVSPATIRRWCRLGHLTAFQVGPGAAIRIPAAELRALLQRLEEESG